MDEERRAFLAGERPDDVLIYLNESVVSNGDSLADHGEAVESGVVLVLPGDQGRSAFERIVGVAPMAFAGAAMDNESSVDSGCVGGSCPSAGANPADHRVRVLLAFAEQQNEEAGGLYAEGDVIHAYAGCTCGTTYSDRWVADETER